MSNLLDHYVRSWSLSHPEKLTQTLTDTIYKVESISGPSILKIFTGIGAHDEAGGNLFLKKLSGKGTAKLYNADERAQLIEFLPGPSLYSYSKANQEKEATKQFIKVIEDIQSIGLPESSDKLMTLEKLVQIFDQIDPPLEMKELFFKAKTLYLDLVSSQKKTLLLHGDLHHENVMKNKDGDFVCFDPKGVIADPAYELGTTLKNPWDYPQISQNIDIFRERALTFSQSLELSYDRIVKFAYLHLCLSIAWAIEDKTDYSHQKTLVKKVIRLL